MRWQKYFQTDSHLNFLSKRKKYLCETCRTIWVIVCKLLRTTSRRENLFFIRFIFKLFFFSYFVSRYVGILHMKLMSILMSMNKSRNLYNIYKILLEAKVTPMIIFQCHFVVSDMSNILSNLINVGLSLQIFFFWNCFSVFVRNLINLWWYLNI